MEKRWKWLLRATVIVLISVAVKAQPQASGTGQATLAPAVISPGTVLEVEMSSGLDAKKAHAGDVFRTKLWGDVRVAGKVVLPQKTVIVGHVVEAQARNKGNNSPSKLTIAFDKAVLKDGSEIPLHGVVERVQLSSVALAAANDAKEHSNNPTPFRGSTTNVAMPTAGSTADSNDSVGPGPTNIKDGSVVTQPDPARAQTVLTSPNEKDEVKVRQFATLDLRVTHSSQ